VKKKKTELFTLKLNRIRRKRGERLTLQKRPSADYYEKKSWLRPEEKLLKRRGGASCSKGALIRKKTEYYQVRGTLTIALRKLFTRGREREKNTCGDSG